MQHLCDNLVPEARPYLCSGLLKRKPSQVLKVTDSDGRVTHSELRFGETALMCGPLKDPDGKPSGSYSFLGDEAALRAYAQQVAKRGEEI